MAFYSTFPFDNMVGPGIGRAEYGGFLMSLPPRRMYDVWQDADYEYAESKSERLLLAALVSVIAMIGCGASGSGYFGHQPKTYPLTITATSGGHSHSNVINLVVE
jgi:hypothetical protein